MTINEMIDKLETLKAAGKGNLEILFQDKEECFGWSFSGKYQIGHCDPEGFLWHSIDAGEALQLEGYILSEEPDIVMFS